MKKDRAIGIFDSGLGGLSVLKRLQEELPGEDFIFFGDQKHAPYGEKSEEEVRSLSLSAYRFLQERGVKATVIACNTATSAAAPYLRELFPEDIIIGMEPAVKPAVEHLHALKHLPNAEAIQSSESLQASESLQVSEALQDFEDRANRSNPPKILIMATEHTIKGERLQQLISRFAHPSQFLLLPSPGIVRILEAGKGDSPEMQDYLEKLLLPYQKESISSIVLGCTHYPFVKKQIQKALPYPVAFFDGAEGTAKETRHRLEEKGLLKEGKQEGTVQLFSSNEDSSFIEAFYQKNCLSQNLESLKKSWKF